jgi:hypothetical protein
MQLRMHVRRKVLKVVVLVRQRRGRELRWQAAEAGGAPLLLLLLRSSAGCSCGCTCDVRCSRLLC